MAEVERQRPGETETGSTASVVQTSDPSGSPVLIITGELDISSAGSVRQLVLEAVAAGPNKVIFDLGGLEFMDSTGIALLVTVAEQIETVEIRNPSKIVRRIIELSGLMDTLHLTSCT
jgi:anti-sigma B factor antagonist